MGSRNSQRRQRWSIRCVASLSGLLASATGAAQPATARLPIIDMHMHAAQISPGAAGSGLCTPVDPPVPLWDQRRPFAEAAAAMYAAPACDDPVRAPGSDEALMRETLAAMERANVFGVVGGMGDARSPVIDRWLDAAPQRFWAGSRCVPGMPDCSVEYLRELHAAGRLQVLAEIYTLLDGVPVDGAALAPYWALAEELDIPVGIHVGGAIPPAAAYLGAERYRAGLHDPLALEEVLVRHPRLRLYVMHAGYPLLDRMMALMYAHPQVYVDTAAIVWHMPRAGFYRYLEALCDGGLCTRVMFGSDNLQFPGLIERAIAVIEEAPFLDEGEKRDVLYNNAARFLRLSEEEIARHHAAGDRDAGVGRAFDRDAAAAGAVTGRAAVNGGTIEYVVSGPANGEPLLLIHGAMLGTALARVQQSTALDGYRVIRMHRRGHVGSSDPAGPMSPADEAADAIGLLDALGVRRAHVAGHSIGAAFVLEMAAAAPDRLRTLILIDPASVPGLGVLDPIAAIAAGAAPPPALAAPTSLEEFVAGFSFLVFGEDWHEYYDASPGGFDQAVTDAGRMPPNLTPWNFSRAQVEAIDRPALVLWGDDSPLKAPAMAIVEALPGAEGREIGGTDHALITQKPDAVAAAIAAFIAAHQSLR